MGATPWQVLRFVIIPIIGPSLVGVGLFGFTLSFDEFARSLLSVGSKNTLPLEIFGMTTTVTTPTLYALGTLTTAVSFMIIGIAHDYRRLGTTAAAAWQRCRPRHGECDGYCSDQSQHDNLDDRAHAATAAPLVGGDVRLLP